MGIDVRTLLRGASQAGAAWLQGRRDEESVQREEQQADQERAIQKAREAAEAARREQERQDRMKADAADRAYQQHRDRISDEQHAAELLARQQERLPTPTETEADELNLRILRERAAAAEAEGRGRNFTVSDRDSVGARLLGSTLSSDLLDPRDIQTTMARVQRNALINALIQNEGMTPEQAEAEATRRMGRGS